MGDLGAMPVSESNGSGKCPVEGVEKGGGGGSAGTQVLLTINSVGIVQSVENTVIQMFGYIPEEVIGSNVSILMPEPYRSHHDLYLARYMKTGTKRIMTGGWRAGAQGVQAVDKYGRIFDVKISITAVVVDKGAFDCTALVGARMKGAASFDDVPLLESEEMDAEAMMFTPPPAAQRAAPRGCPVTGISRSAGKLGSGCPFSDPNSPERDLTETQELHFVGLLEKVAGRTLRISLDGDLSIMSVNNEITTIFGYGPHDIVGRSIGQIVPEAGTAGGLEKFLKTDVLREEMSTHTLGMGEDGSHVPIDVAVTTFAVSSDIPLSTQRVYYCEITDLRLDNLVGSLVCDLNGVVKACNSNTMPVLGLSMLEQSSLRGSHISRFLVGLENFRHQLLNETEGDMMCTCLSGRCLVSVHFHVLDVAGEDGGKCMVNIRFGGPRRTTAQTEGGETVGSVARDEDSVNAFYDNWKAQAMIHPHEILHAYQIEETLGKGAFGRVYRAVHRITGRAVAIKEISDKSTSARNIEREIANHQRVGGHPNIITAFKALRNGNFTYIVLELATGGEMFDYVASCPDGIVEAEARLLFAQILGAVDYMHRKGVVHRDLKLENVLFDDKRVPKITDFGLSKQRVSQTSRMDTFCGSPAYAAPEIYSKLKYEGPEVDMWSVGVMLYTCIVGCYPYEDEKPPHAGSPLPHIPETVSRLCADLLKKLLASDSSMRITAEEAIQHPWLLHPVFRWPTRIIYRRFATSPSAVREVDGETEATVPIDEDVVSEMVSRGYSQLMVYSSLNSGFFDQPSTTYRLLARALVSEDFIQCPTDPSPKAGGDPAHRRNMSEPVSSARLMRSSTTKDIHGRESAALKNSGLGRDDASYVVSASSKFMREIKELPGITPERCAAVVNTLCAELRQQAAEAGWSTTDDQNIPLQDLTLGREQPRESVHAADGWIRRGSESLAP